MPQENKLYLNIQEQVEKNKKDILDIQQGATVLADFGIKVIGQVNESSELPDPAEYEGDYGDAYAVGTEAPYDFYIFTRAFEGQDEPSWFNIGEFPVPGPQGEQGPAGQDGSNGRGISSIAKTSTSGLEDTYTITYTDGSTSTYVVKNGANGQAAAINSVTATVDSGTGTPSVEVSLGGTEQSRSFAFAFHNLRGVQGEMGEPGSFIFGGQVASSTLLPDASNVQTKYLYLVGASEPYDVYAIIEAGGVKSWINLGPVAVTISDTKVGANTWSSSGTLSAEVLNEIVNTPTMDFIRIGDRYFCKQSAGHYYALKRESYKMFVYGMTIDLSTGEWTIATEEMVDVDTDQTIFGEKKIQNVPLSFKNTSAGGSAEYGIEEDSNGRLVISRTYNSSKVSKWLIDDTVLVPATDNVGDIGSSSKKVKDIYITGSLKNGTNSLSVADIANSKLNVINASDIVSNTLTEAQLALFRNGKPTIILGRFLDIDNGLYLTASNYQTTTYQGLLFGAKDDSYQRQRITGYEINKNTRVISLSSISKLINYEKVNQLNGKDVPDYPSSTGTFVLKCVNGTLTWVAE